MRENHDHNQLAPLSGLDQEMKDFFHQLFPQENSPSSTQTDFATYLGMLRRRKWFIIVPLFIIPILAGLLVLAIKPMYEATATLLIEPVNPKIVQFEEVVGPDRSSDYLLTQYKLLQSRDMAEKVIDALKSKSALKTKEFKDVLIKDEKIIKQPEKFDADSISSKDISDDVTTFHVRILQDVKEMLGVKTNVILPDSNEIKRHDQIKKLMKSTSVEPVHGTRLVDITILGPDPYEITDQVNTLTEVFVAQNLENKLNASKQASVWLKDEVSNLKSELNKAEFSLIDFIDSHGYTPQEEAQNNGNDRKMSQEDEAKAILKSTKTQRFEFESRLTELERLAELFTKRQRPIVSVLNIPTIANLQAQYLDAESKLRGLSDRYTATHPKIIDLISTMDSLKQRMILAIRDQIERIKFDISILNEKEKSLESIKVEEISAKVVSYKDKTVYETLKRDVENKRNLYETMLKRLNETEVTKGLETNNIMISQKAVVPIEPMPSRKKKVMAAGIMVALGIGIGLAFVREKLDRRFHSPDEAEQYMKIPHLGIIPRHTLKKVNFQYEFMNPQRSYSNFPNAYRQLRTNIQFRSLQKEIKTLLITSSIQGEGKSTTVANLGLSFAQLGKSILLVDADLRNPTLHTLFDLPNRCGLSDILTRGVAWKQCIQHTATENVKVITSGPKPLNPVELLSMRKMKTLCNELKDEFDLTIFDASALLGIPDACILGTEMDAVLLIHDSESVNRTMFLEAKSNLEQVHANILGLIFNNVKTTTYSSYRYLLNDSNNNTRIVEANVHSEKPKENNKTENISINITQALFREEVNEETSREESALLELDLEISNHSNSTFIFESYCAKICLKQTSKYGNAVSSLFDITDESVNKIGSSVFSPHLLTRNLQNGLKDKEIVESHETVIGKIIYKVPCERRQYMFVYNGHEEDFNINIPLAL